MKGLRIVNNQYLSLPGNKRTNMQHNNNNSTCLVFDACAWKRQTVIAFDYLNAT